MKTEITERGFRFVDFKDRNNDKCSIQESSLAIEAVIWFGIEGNRMYLTQEKVRELLLYILFFIQEGYLPTKAELSNTRLMLSIVKNIIKDNAAKKI